MTADWEGLSHVKFVVNDGTFRRYEMDKILFPSGDEISGRETI